MLGFDTTTDHSACVHCRFYHRFPWHAVQASSSSAAQDHTALLTCSHCPREFRARTGSRVSLLRTHTNPTLQIQHIKMVIFLTEGRAHTYSHNGFSERSSDWQSSSPASHKTEEEEETSQQTAKRNKTKPIYRVQDSAVRFYTSSACISVHPNWMEQKLRQLGALRPTAALSL